MADLKVGTTRATATALKIVLPAFVVPAFRLRVKLRRTAVALAKAVRPAACRGAT